MYWTSESGDELYDLEADPDELTNLADDPGHGTVVAELDAARRALVECAGEACGRPLDWTPWF